MPTSIISTWGKRAKSFARRFDRRHGSARRGGRDCAGMARSIRTITRLRPRAIRDDTRPRRSEPAKRNGAACDHRFMWRTSGANARRRRCGGAAPRHATVEQHHASCPHGTTDLSHVRQRPCPERGRTRCSRPFEPYRRAHLGGFAGSRPASARRRSPCTLIAIRRNKVCERRRSAAEARL